MEFIYKKLCIYPYMFKLQSPSKCSSFDEYTYRDAFSTVQNSFWTHRFLCPLMLLPFLCITSSTSAKHIPLRTFFNLEKQKKVAWGEIRWIGQVGHGGHAIFWSKTAKHSAHCGQVCLWISIERVSKKKFTEAKCSLSQQHQLVHGYRWLLEYSPSRGSLYYKGCALQKIILFGGSPLVHTCRWAHTSQRHLHI